MTLEKYLELFQMEYCIQITSYDGTKFYLKGDIL